MHFYVIRAYSIKFTYLDAFTLTLEVKNKEIQKQIEKQRPIFY